jgi:acetate---CoA ligase (ADP-forming)
MWPAMTDPRARDLAPLMKPRSVAIIGASQRMSRATRVVRNLQQFGYRGRIFPINPKYDEVLGLPCFPDLASTPEPAESVVVGIPAEQVPPILSAAVDSGVRAAVVLSSGFAEAGPAGQARQAALERLAAERGLLICGPNCYASSTSAWARRRSALTWPRCGRGPSPSSPRAADSATRSPST